MVVATGNATATLLDVQSGALVARVPVAGGTRAVAVAPDGSRGYVAAGAGVAAIDLNARTRVGDVQLTGTPTAIAISASGHRLVAVRKGALDSIDPIAMTVTRSVNLGAKARKPAAVAISADGAKAVVALDAKRIAIVDLLGGGVRRMKLAGVTGIAFAPTGRNAFAATATKKDTTLTTIDTAAGRLGHRIRTARGPGGGVAVSGDGRHVIVGPGAGSRVTAVFDLKRGRVTTRVATGAGPGRPAVAPDGVRLYVADERAGTISVLSALSFRRLTIRKLPGGGHPRGLAGQPRASATRSTRWAATTSRSAAAAPTFSPAARATTHSTAAPTMTRSTARTATTTSSPRPATTRSTAARAMTMPTAGPATTSSTAPTATTASTAATVTTCSVAAPATTA
jgi:DNA-binding beta-propeller fold protein YncE